MWIIGHPKSWKIGLFENWSAVSYAHSDSSRALSCILDIKRDIGRKYRFFHTLHSTPQLVGPLRNIA